MPVPPVLSICILNPPHRHMGCAGRDLVVASRASIRLESPRPRNLNHFTVVAVRPGLDPAEHQNNRNSSLSIPRIES
jgi:hypothetical protein